MISGSPWMPWVAPFTGAWIEIARAWWVMSDDEVAPFTGAWIEIVGRDADGFIAQSLPSRERGLKFEIGPLFGPDDVVAPFTGAWIEIKIRRDT